MKSLGLYNTHLSLIFSYIAFGLPIAVLIFRDFLQNHNSTFEAGNRNGDRFPVYAELERVHTGPDTPEG
jgi:hypothetical protein